MMYHARGARIAPPPAPVAFGPGRAGGSTGAKPQVDKRVGCGGDEGALLVAPSAAHCHAFPPGQRGTEVSGVRGSTIVSTKMVGPCCKLKQIRGSHTLIVTVCCQTAGHE